MIALDGLPFSVFVTSKDLRKCLNALGHEIPLSAETIKIKVCRYADTFREKVVRELQMEKEKGQLFSLTLDEWTSIRSKRYLNIDIHSRTKVWNLGLTRISGVFSSEQCKYVIGAKLLEFGIDFETDIVCVTTDGCAMMLRRCLNFTDFHCASLDFRSCVVLDSSLYFFPLKYGNYLVFDCARVVSICVVFLERNPDVKRAYHFLIVMAKFIPFKSEGIWCYYLRNGSGQNAQCIPCKRILKCVGGSTKGLHVHQKAVHGIKTSKRKVKDEVDTQTPAKKTPKISILDHFSSVSIDRSTDAVLARMIALDGLPFSVFVTSKDLRKCLNALGHEIPLSAETIKIKVCRYADTFREKVVRELQMEKEKGQLFSLTLDEWTSIRSKRYLNIDIHSRTKVWNLGLTRISGVFSSEQCKYVIGAKLLEFGIDFETDIVCVTTDGCAMMVKLGHIIGPLQQLCYAHGLHLAVMDVLYAKKKREGCS
ncbi:hypothetical protein LAZ67_11003411 [Cordylochernes scorpioides]|uniref:Uncharacterized protein n=1 Tax=Cordylochernes scorpioides TaxID=51811 RepID=A0ABY6L2J0_9ARAC|nr:hypothetical protein LAZ67_11003411 [Cordylochernes scorpioides]